MKNKIFLSSMLIMSVAPAMAENFPSNGLMQENKTYDNAATSTNMDGVYEGSVNATAEYENILYNIVAGNYLPAGSEDTNGAQCTAGNFCTGLTNATYSESDQGLTSCSTLGDGSYTLSPAGATDGNMCYKTCSASCTNPTAPAHSTNVTYGHETSNGTWNYGASCNAVAPTCSINFDCVNGYHKRPDLTVAQGVALYKQMAQMQGQDITNVPDSYFESQIIDGYANWNSFWSSLSAAEQVMVNQAIDSVQGHTHTSSGTQTVSIWQPFIDFYEEMKSSTEKAVRFNVYYYSKNLSGVEECKLVGGMDLNFVVEDIGCNVAAQQNSELALFRQNAQNGDWFYIIPEKNIKESGQSKCDYSFSLSCRKKYTMINGVSATSDWFEGSDMGWEEGTGECESGCAEEAIAWSLSKIIFGLKITENAANSVQVASDTITISDYYSAPYIDYMCDANTITINWNDVDPEYAGQNGEDTAKYDGDIKTPVKAATKKGQRFKGWRFSNPQTTNLSE